MELGGSECLGGHYEHGSACGDSSRLPVAVGWKKQGGSAAAHPCEGYGAEHHSQPGHMGCSRCVQGWEERGRVRAEQGRCSVLCGTAGMVMTFPSGGTFVPQV